MMVLACTLYLACCSTLRCLELLSKADSYHALLNHILSLFDSKQLFKDQNQTVLVRAHLLEKDLGAQVATVVVMSLIAIPTL